LVEGETESSLLSGAHSIDLVGPTVAGMRLVGVEAGEHAGFSVAPAGDLDADGVRDFVAGAPDRTYQSDAHAGTVYLVTESVPDPPGSCDQKGCTVVDLRNGAQLAVPPGSLQGPAFLAVAGLVDDQALSNAGISLPEGMMLAGAADYDDEGQGFPGDDPTAHVPTNEWAERQIEDLEVEEVFYHDEELGWIGLGPLGTVQENPHYPARKAVAMTVNPLHVYAVLLMDSDGDKMRDERDCAPGDGTVFNEPHEIGNVAMPSKTLLEWGSDAGNSGESTVYDVMRGDLDELNVLGSGAGELCIVSGLPENFQVVDDSSGLGPGEGYFYLIRGDNSCGTGSYGQASPPAERISTVCD
jgi:hypothetical protein